MKAFSESFFKDPWEGCRVFDDEVRYLFGVAALAKLVKRSLVVLKLVDAQFLTNGAREIDEGRTMGTDINDGIASVKRRIQDLPLTRGDTSCSTSAGNWTTKSQGSRRPIRADWDQAS